VRLGQQRGVHPDRSAQQVAGELVDQRVGVGRRVGRQQLHATDRGREPADVLPAQRRQGIERGLQPSAVDRPRRAGAEQPDAAVFQQEWVTRARIGWHEHHRPRGPAVERHQGPGDGARVGRGRAIGERWALEQLGHQDAGCRQLPMHRGHGHAIKPARRPREAPLRGARVLEVELVEHPLARLAQQRAGVGGGEHPRERLGKGIEQDEVGAHRRL
jgi:hypothetical protein